MVNQITRLSLLSAAVVLMLAGGIIYAAPGGVKGPPENPGGGGGNGPPENPGGGGGKPDQPGRGKGNLYADLVILHRTVDGLPIFSGVPAGTPEEPEEVAEGYVPCLQPITAAWVDDPEIGAYAASLNPPLPNPLMNPADGKLVSPVPLGGTGIAGEECDVRTVPTDFTAFAQEVLFGRLNLGRSPTKVLAQQLRDVIGVLESATTLTLDAAGRLAADGAEIDSPGQNLAIHAELQKSGQLTASDQTSIELPMPPVSGYSFLDHAAAALGAAADKGGLVNLDLVVYNNRILNIPNETEFSTLEGNGDIGEDGEQYYDYNDYSYDREAKYPGCVTGFFVIGDQSVPFSGPLMHFVFNNEGFMGSNVHGFATNADDSRRVIAFVHDNIITNVDTVGERTDAWCPLEDPR